MRHKLLAVLFLVVFSPSFGLTPVGAEAEPVNLTGTWAVQYMGSQGPIKMTFVFKQTGEKLTDDYSGPFGPYKVRGIVKGKQVVFGWEQEGNGVHSSQTSPPLATDFERAQKINLLCRQALC